MYEAYISFKDRGKDGRKSKDSDIANQLCKKLASLGVTVFPNDTDVQSIDDPDYEKKADAALEEAKVLIVIGTCLDHVKDKRVEHEWRNFSGQIKSGKDKKMITIMEGFSLLNLPPAFAQVRNYSSNNLESAADEVGVILGKVKKSAQNERLKTAQPAAGGKKKKPILPIIAVTVAAAIICGVFVLPKLGTQKIVNLDNNVKVGSHVFFGNYPQIASPEPIEWRVLDVRDGKALLISEYLLDVHIYDTSTDNWNGCQLRRWLNNDFMNKAFSPEEQQRLLDIEKDKVSILTKEEAEKYFKNDKDRKGIPTVYAVLQGAYQSEDNHGGWWWLRTPASDSNSVRFVSSNGGFEVFGFKVSIDDVCVRPVILVSL